MNNAGNGLVIDKECGRCLPLVSSSVITAHRTLRTHMEQRAGGKTESHLEYYIRYETLRLVKIAS